MPHSIENLRPSPTTVFRNILEYMAVKFPDFDYDPLLLDLTKNQIIDRDETALISESSNWDYRGMCLFLETLPTKPSEKLERCFDILRGHMQDEKFNEFLNEQRCFLERRVIQNIQGDVYPFVGSIANSDGQNAKISPIALDYSKDADQQSDKDVSNLALMLDTLKQGQVQLAESVDKLLNDIQPIFSQMTQIQPTLEAQTASEADESGLERKIAACNKRDQAVQTEDETALSAIIGSTHASRTGDSASSVGDQRNWPFASPQQPKSVDVRLIHGQIHPDPGMATRLEQMKSQMNKELQQRQRQLEEQGRRANAKKQKLLNNLETLEAEIKSTTSRPMDEAEQSRLEELKSNVTLLKLKAQQAEVNAKLAEVKAEHVGKASNMSGILLL